MGLLLEYSVATQSYGVFFVNGTVEQRTNITKRKIGQCEKNQFQGKAVSEIDRYLAKIRFCYGHYTLNLGQ
jgi:hypothetical protein